MPWEKQFNRDEALARAGKAFWTGGYEATSLETLLDSMGIHKGSFYATFSSKHDALLEAMNQYVADRFKAFEQLSTKCPPLEALRRHFDAVLAESSGPECSRGCFLVNMALELAPRDKAVRSLVRRTLQAHQDFYRRLLEGAKATGALAAGYDVDAAAAELLAVLLGIRVMARAGMPKTTIRALRDRAVAIAGG